MAAGLPHDLDGFIPLLLTSDIRMKVTVGCKLFTYLEEPGNSIECSDIGMFIDGIVQWLLNSNPKVTQYGIEIITQLINRMRIDFRPYISTILPIVIDRIGDCKEPIKVKTLFLVMKLMECNTISPQALFDKISVNAFNHKNSSVKEGSMKLLLLTIEEFGANCITISKIIPMIIKLLSDPNVQVRQKAFETLVDLYKHVGEKLRIDIQKNYSIPQNKMTDLMNKFDEVKLDVNLLTTTSVGLSLINDDESDRACTFAPKRVSSIKRPTSFLPLKSNSTSPLQQVDFVRKSTLSSALSASHACGVDENTFIQSFEDVPILNIYSVRDLDDIMKKIHESIQDSNEQWNKRVDSLKKIRSLVLVGATKYEEFFNNLRYLEHSFQISIKDLRSQVIRETCITIAFLSQRLGNKFNHFSESIFSNLIDLIQNSAKVTASSGLVAIRFILEYTHAPRIIPILANSLESKSKDIRRACCEFFDQILCKWPTQAIERHLTILQDCIKKGIADADSSARMYSRKAYWEFCEHFPEHGEILLSKLEPTYRKMLLTSSGSNSCLSKSVTAESTKLNYHRLSSSHSNVSVRSRSAIDFQAVKSSKAHAQNSTLITQKFNPVVSNQPVIKKSNENVYQTDREGRSRVRVSLSQTINRSGSPSSKLNFVQTKSNRTTSGIPKSRDTSREVSPNRFNIRGTHINSKELPSLVKPRPIMAQKILIQSQEAESAINDVSSDKNCHKSPRKKLERLFNDYSDDSETSSVCSERKIDYRKRFSDSFYLNGSQYGQHKEVWKNSSLKCLNIEDIISSCESSNWNNRKEGLLSLLKYFQQGNIVSKLLLTKITEVFTKMIMDSQTKAISLFLDVLNELIITHNQFLEYWLYTLLVKLFNKGGSDILSSVHTKILKTLEIIRSSFPCDLQLTAVFKFLTDPTQTPNIKIKIFAMSYISQLAVGANSGSIFLSVVNDKKDYAILALIKMIGWTMCNNNIKQGSELRRASQEALLALYNLNASQITLRLSQLPEEYQEVFSRLLKIKVRRSSIDQITSLNYRNSQIPTNLASPPLQPDTIDIFNSEETHKSFKQSTDKVQKCRLKNHYSEEISAALYESRINHLSIHTKTNNHNLNSFSNGHTTVDDGIIKILDDLDKDTLQLHYKQSILIHLKELIKDDCSSCELVNNFEKIIKVIFKLLIDTESIIREQTMTLVIYLVQKSELVAYFHDYTELIILKVINMCCDSYKSVVKVAEECLIALSISLHTETVVKIITPLILAKEFPVKLIAIRMMTKIIDIYGSPPVTDQIKDIMSGLLQSYDNPDSAIRKSAVFCMVSLYKVFGSQEFIPHISSLNGAKLKLLNLYIERSQKSIKIN